MAQGEEPNTGQGTTGAKYHGENWQDLEVRMESIKAYLKAEAKTEKDAKALKARLNLAGEERDLTSKEKYKKNLKAEKMQTHEGLEEIKTDLEKIQGGQRLRILRKRLKGIAKAGRQVLKGSRRTPGAVERGRKPNHVRTSRN